MCRWMGWHFQDWIDHNWGRIFIRVTRMGSHIFRFLGVRQFFMYFGSAVVFTLYDVISDCMYSENLNMTGCWGTSKLCFL